MSRVNVGERIRQLRLDSGMSVRTLATKSGFSPSLISQVEHGQVMPSIGSLERIAMALGVSLSTFFAELDPSATRLVRASARPQLTSTWSPVSIEALGSLDGSGTLEPIMLIMAPGGRSGIFPATPGGEKFALLIEGEVTLTLGDQVHVPWCGRLGKVDNCQVAMYLGYVSRKGHTLVDQRLFLPKEWTKDKARLDKAGVPKAYRAYRTRHQLALELLAKNGAGLPHGWISGDDEMGRPYWFRRRLATLGERYLLAVPSNTAMRDLETEPPEYRGQGRRPRAPWQSVEAWSQSLGEEAWHRIDVRDGSKGPLVVEAVKRRMLSRTHRRQPGDEEMLVVIRYRDRDQQEVVKVDYYLSNATPETTVWEFA